MDVSRRDFIRLGTSAAVTTNGGGTGERRAGGSPCSSPNRVAAARGLRPRRSRAQVRSRHRQRRRAGPEPAPARQARPRHQERADRGDRPRHPADRSVQRIDAAGKLVIARPHRPAHAPLPAPRHRSARRRAGRRSPRTTTAVSAGDAGAYTFGNFRHGVVPQSRTRLFGFVHISTIGLAGGLAPGEMLNIDYANVDACAKAVAENADLVLGRQGAHDRLGGRPERARAAPPRHPRRRDRGQAVPRDVPHRRGAGLALRSARPAAPRRHPHARLQRGGQQHGAERAAPARGARAPSSAASSSTSATAGARFDFTVCEPAMAQGFSPDTISSDIHAVSINTPGYPTLPWVMSKFLAMGMPLEEVVARATLGAGDASSAASRASARWPSARPPTWPSSTWSTGPSSSWTRATTGARGPRSWCRC